MVQSQRDSTPPPSCPRPGGLLSSSRIPPVGRPLKATASLDRHRVHHGVYHGHGRTPEHPHHHLCSDVDRTAIDFESISSRFEENWPADASQTDAMTLAMVYTGRGISPVSHDRRCLPGHEPSPISGHSRNGNHLRRSRHLSDPDDDLSTGTMFRRKGIQHRPEPSSASTKTLTAPENLIFEPGWSGCG